WVHPELVGQWSPDPRTLSPAHPEGRRPDPEGRHRGDGIGGVVMIHPDVTLARLADELANALQTAVLIADRLHVTSSAGIQDAIALSKSLRRATDAPTPLRGGGGPL